MERSFHIEDFKVNNNETDFSDSVPKLKGQSNYEDWETAFCLALIRTRARELAETNEELCKEHHRKWDNWQSCNSRAFIQLRKTLTIEAASLVSQITDVHEAFKKLREKYAAFSFQHMYARYTKWVDLRFKNGTASDFVRRFQEALRDLTAFGGSVTPRIELCQFKKAIAENARCYAFQQDLEVNENDPNLMNCTLNSNRSLNPSHPSAND
ncbi:hypothetical protein N7501_001514 [Penicillium viridicatum]|nr:hypothetical protein N7501_001514 [Penicillium viridicatum]